MAIAATLHRPAPPRVIRGVLLGAAALVVGTLVGAVLVAVVATRFFDYSVLTVSSGSMAPALRNGDLIIVRPAAIGDIKTRDIVLFESGGDRIPTVHRVIGVNDVETRITDRTTGAIDVSHDYRLVTKGDANPEADSREVTADRLRGAVWFTVPHVGALGNAGIAAVLGIVFGVAATGWAAWEISLRLRAKGDQKS